VDDARDVPGIPGATARSVDVRELHLPGSIPYSPLGETAAGKLLLKADGVGLFLISSGNTIEYAVTPGADPVAVERFLWGAARSALIHQRGELPLHASAVTRSDGRGAIALCGPSGAGKSTTAAALMRFGWRVLADDLVRITFDDGNVRAWPGPPHIKLRGDACEKLAVDTLGLSADGEDGGKFLIPVSVSKDAVPLTSIVELDGPEADLRLERLEGAAGMAVLSRHIVGPRKMRALRTPGQHFEFVQKIFGKLRMHRLHGRSTSPVEAVAGQLHEVFG
jgi:hypothetical protein